MDAVDYFLFGILTVMSIGSFVMTGDLATKYDKMNERLIFLETKMEIKNG